MCVAVGEPEPLSNQRIGKSHFEKAATHGVEEEDGAELDEAVQSHVPEEAEGGDQRTPALSAHTHTHNNLLLLCILLQKTYYKHFWLRCFLRAFLMPPPRSPDEQRHTADVFRLGRERRRDRRLGFGQGNPDVSGPQGPAVIGPVPAHAHPVAGVREVKEG